MKAEETYKEYDQKVIEYMKNLILNLEKEYGSVNDTWRVSLDLIAYNYSIILKCKEDIDKNGFTAYDERGRTIKNPSISIFNNAQSYLVKLLNNFGLTLMSKSKMKQLDIDTSDPLEDLLS